MWNRRNLGFIEGKITNMALSGQKAWNVNNNHIKLWVKRVFTLRLRLNWLDLLKKKSKIEWYIGCLVLKAADFFFAIELLRCRFTLFWIKNFFFPLVPCNAILLKTTRNTQNFVTLVHVKWCWWQSLCAQFSSNVKICNLFLDYVPLTNRHTSTMSLGKRFYPAFQRKCWHQIRKRKKKKKHKRN